MFLELSGMHPRHTCDMITMKCVSPKRILCTEITIDQRHFVNIYIASHKKKKKKKIRRMKCWRMMALLLNRNAEYRSVKCKQFNNYHYLRFDVII